MCCQISQHEVRIAAAAFASRSPDSTRTAAAHGDLSSAPRSRCIKETAPASTPVRRTSEPGLLCPFGSLVFVETGAFDADRARAILTAGAAKGLGLRVHANQLGPAPGIQLVCELGAAAAGHCTHLADADIDALASSGVVAGLLPAVEFSTRSPYLDARRLLDAGANLSLASDCNPGSRTWLAGRSLMTTTLCTRREPFSSGPPMLLIKE